MIIRANNTSWIDAGLGVGKINYKSADIWYLPGQEFAERTEN